jgi:FkbM family methyltransferase
MWSAAQREARRWRWQCGGGTALRLALALAGTLAVAALWREGAALAGRGVARPAAAPAARWRARECSATEAAFQGENVDIALIRGCPPRDDAWMRLVRLHMPHARTFLDIGSNKGYTGARFFNLWNPELDLTSRELDRHNNAVSNSSEFTWCGHCNECDFAPPPLVDAHERLCRPERASSQVPEFLANISAAQARVCASRRKSFRPIRVLSFDGNVRLVEALRRSIAHRASSSAAELAVFKALSELTIERISDMTELATIGCGVGSSRRAGFVRSVQDALGLAPGAPSTEATATAAPTPQQPALVLGNDARTVRHAVRAFEAAAALAPGGTYAVATGPESAAIIARQWTVELRALTASCAPGETLSFVLDGEMGHVVDGRNASVSETNDRVESRVPCITVDQVLQREGLREIDVLKIDAEGHDLDVLEGAKGALAGRRVALILFEYNNFWPALREGRNSLQHAADWLHGMGYVCYLEGKNVLARLTGCWHDRLADRIWRNVYCVSLDHLPGLVQVFDANSLAFLA